ncbi:uncharacterized protein TNCV_4213491 [Trichonephila clavipes]|nr:uncharacterized protein TNCV_4213491 [Trichonephila clavipes]
MNMKRKENFQMLPKEIHQLKYEAISVPQGSVRLVKKTQGRESSTCYLLNTKDATSSSPVPLKTRREWGSLNEMQKDEKSFVKEREKTNRKSSRKNDKKKTEKNIAHLFSITAKSPSEYMREYQARKKEHCKTLLILSLKDGNAIETLLMTAQINTELVNHPVPLNTEPSTSLVSVGTDACKSVFLKLWGAPP